MSQDYEGIGPLQLTRFSGGVGCGPSLQLTQGYGTGMPCGNGYISIRMEKLPSLIADLQAVQAQFEEAAP